MHHDMAHLKALANEHMQRDIEAGGEWTCECEACHDIRSLIGVEKMLEVRPLVRDVQQVEERLHEVPDGPEKRILQSQYVYLQEKLAETVAK